MRTACCLHMRCKLNPPTPSCWVPLLGCVFRRISGRKHGSTGYEDPVCPLILALDGHPNASAFWEKHCEAKLIEVGFIRVPEWPSVFYYFKYKLFRVVHVDDFKMSGLSLHWMGSHCNGARHLGCKHEFAAADAQGFFDPHTAWTVDHPPSKEVRDVRFGEKRFRADEVKIQPCLSQHNQV